MIDWREEMAIYSLLAPIPRWLEPPDEDRPYIEFVRI
jgi:hypothetical protein